MKLKSLIAGALAGIALAGAAAPAMAQEKLTVWWVKGFYKSEDDALFAAIKKFEAKHPKIKIELSQYPIQDMIPKTVAALDSGSPPKAQKHRTPARVCLARAGKSGLHEYPIIIR